MNERIKTAVNTAPKNREQVRLWVKGFLGFDLHSTCRCVPKPNEVEEWAKNGQHPHQSQLDYVYEAFSNQYSACVLMACRGAGKSFATAAVCILDCWFKPNIKIAVAAFVRQQSDYIYNYIQQFLTYMAKAIGEECWTIAKDEITFDNGSSVKFFSGGKSQANVTGYHPHVLICDEADKFSAEQFDGIANGLEGSKGYPSRFDVLSTNYSLSGDGVILKQIERYEAFNASKPDHLLPRKVFRICLIDILETCDDRYKCWDEVKKAHCPLWKYCKGRAKEVEGGFYQVSEAIGKMLNSSRPTFESQMLLLRPSSEFSYYPEFSTAVHVLEAERVYDPSLLTIIAVDFGSGRCPHAAVIAQKDKDGVYWIIAEFEHTGHLELMVEEIKRQFPKILDADCYYDPAGNKKEHMREAKSFAQILRAAGFFPRCKALKRKATFDLLGNLIAPAAGDPKIFLNKSCKHLIRQIQAAENEVVRGKIINEPKDGKGDDLLDCLRYIIGWTCGNYAKPASHQAPRRFFNA